MILYGAVCLNEIKWLKQMSEILTDADLKAAMGLPKNARQSTLEKELRLRGLPFGYGRRGLFSMKSLWEEKLTGNLKKAEDDDPIEF